MGERYDFSESGVHLLTLEIFMPALPEGVAGERIGTFLRSVADTVKQGAENALPRLFSQYESDPDPKKRFRHRPCRLSLSFSLCEQKGYYRLQERLALTKGGRLLSEKQRAARFDLQSGRFLKKLREKRKPKKQASPKGNNK